MGFYCISLNIKLGGSLYLGLFCYNKVTVSPHKSSGKKDSNRQYSKISIKFIFPLIQSLVHPCKRNFENMTIILLNNYWNRLSCNMNNYADLELKGIIRRDSQNIPKRSKYAYLCLRFSSFMQEDNSFHPYLALTLRQ